MNEQERKVMEQALEALEALNNTNNHWWQEVDKDTVDKIEPAITALKELLAQKSNEQVEPVAWGNLANWCLDSYRVLITDKDEAEKYHKHDYDLTPLYTHPSVPYVASSRTAQPKEPDRELAEAYRTELDKLSQRNYELRMENAHTVLNEAPAKQQRKPLTDEEILAVARDHYNPHQRPEISFARAIEAAHGITEE